MDKIIGQSPDITAENINRIKELFPTIVSDGKINFDALRAVLGDEIDSSKEKYQFTWNGKSESIKLAQSPSSATLRPCYEKSKNWEVTNNLYIEGDNLEVLKLLQKTYYGRIKMIYIDPPYNTGNDFVYKDDFVDSIKTYKEQTNQSKKSNPDTSGRYHSDWLTMIYPRLILARNLLSEDGVIFISIDDNEQENLKKCCDEVFGSQNFVAQMIWERAYAPKNDARYISNSHDYILMYAKSKDNFVIGRLPRTEEANSRYSNPDNDPRGDWKASDMLVKTFNAECVYPITTPSGRVVEPPMGRCWRLSQKSFEEKVKDNRIWFGPNGNGVPAIKRFLSELKFDGMAPASLLYYKDVGHSQEGAQEVSKLLGGSYFDGPKPLRLMKRMITLANLKSDSIVLDFFSGSASTAHAVMQNNIECDKSCRFIMVQLPERTDLTSDAYRAGYENICDIGETRIKKAGEQLHEQWSEKVNSEGVFAMQNEFLVDTGFKVFKLDSTNINPWDNTNEYDGNTIYNSATVFKLDRTKEDILYEIMLKYGVFDQLVSEAKINGKTVYLVGQRHMIVYLEDNIDGSDIAEICKLGPRVVVFKEDGFKDDNAKINAEYNLKNGGVEDVKCI